MIGKTQKIYGNDQMLFQGMIYITEGRRAGQWQPVTPIHNLESIALIDLKDFVLSVQKAGEK